MEFHFVINSVEFHFESCNFISKSTLLLEFHFPTPTTPTLPHSCVLYPTPTPISCGNKGKNYTVKYLTLRAICATHLSLYINFPYSTPTYQKFVGYLFFVLSLRFALLLVQYYLRFHFLFIHIVGCSVPYPIT